MPGKRQHDILHSLEGTTNESQWGWESPKHFYKKEVTTGPIISALGGENMQGLGLNGRLNVGVGME